MAPQRWFPLESNPILMNHYIEKLGFHTHSYSFVDVFSTDDWALQMIPQPVAAVILLYPLTEKQLSKDDSTTDDDSNVWFMKQRIGNACGTMGILHSLMNSNAAYDLSVRPDSWLANFAERTKGKTAIQKAELLEADDIICTLHDEATSSADNQTDRGNLEDKLILHFIALVRIGDKLYECDGRKEGPICHGECQSDIELLPRAIHVVKQFMAKDPDEMRFTILALAPNH